MVDVSILPEDMAKLALYTGRQLTWIDHHKSAIEDYNKFKADNPVQAEYFKAVLQQGIAACEITWNYLFPNEPMPDAVSLIGQYDTWRDENKSNWNKLVLPFQYGMKAMGVDNPIKVAPGLLNGSPAIIDTIIEQGKIALQYQTNMDKQIMKSSFDVVVDGLEGIACNGAGFGSMAFDSVFDPTKYDLMVPFKFDGINWVVSLYSGNPDVDCSVIAKRYGGGGHASAAGFTTTEFPDFLKV
jgi:oligoribonuclease NrnB/cAMP/cGMP phosphodiesterase (DHH superfamily)